MAGAAVAGLDRHAVDVGGALVVAAAADRERCRCCRRVTPGCSARTWLSRSTGRFSTNSPSTRCLVVTSSRGTSGWVWVTTVISWISTAVCSSWTSTVIGLAGQHLHAFHLGRLVPDEGGADRDRAGGNVVDEVVALGVGEGVERRPHDVHLGVGDGRARLVAHPAFDLTSRALGEERARSQTQRDCRVRDDSRNACEGADTAMLHGYVLQRREPAVRPTVERRARTPPLGSVAYSECDCCGSYTCIRREGDDDINDIVCDDRGPVGAA